MRFKKLLVPTVAIGLTVGGCKVAGEMSYPGKQDDLTHILKGAEKPTEDVAITDSTSTTGNSQFYFSKQPSAGEIKKLQKSRTLAIHVFNAVGLPDNPVERESVVHGRQTNHPEWFAGTILASDKYNSSNKEHNMVLKKVILGILTKSYFSGSPASPSVEGGPDGDGPAFPTFSEEEKFSIYQHPVRTFKKAKLKEFQKRKAFLSLLKDVGITFFDKEYKGYANQNRKLAAFILCLEKLNMLTFNGIDLSNADTIRTLYEKFVSSRDIGTFKPSSATFTKNKKK